MDQNNREILLRVGHLSQYFKMGPSADLKAVDDVSFDIYKGEVFGLVGESGCGKTTTGRTIMKLYDATGGNVYFRGERIVAGFELLRREIKELKRKRKILQKGMEYTGPAINSNVPRTDSIMQNETVEELNKRIYELENRYFLARFDHKYCDYKHQSALVSALKKEKEQRTDEIIKKAISLSNGKYSSSDKKALLAMLRSNNTDASMTELHEEYMSMCKEYSEKIRVGYKERLVNEIQMIFQDPIASLDPRMTVRDIIAEGLIIKGIKDKEYINKMVYESLEKVGLVREHAGRYPHEFSGGQRQRIGIARAMIMRPELIVADEPISALDVSIQAQVINLLNDLRDELGLTILFIAHDLSVVKYFSDRIGVMYYGKMVEMADSEELFAHPTHPYTKSLLSAIPLPDPIHERKRERISYNPLVSHDYTVDKPSFRELAPGHFVMANDVEFERYKQEYNK